MTNFNDNLTPDKYPFMKSREQLIFDLMSSCSIVFNEKKPICRSCDVYRYCLEKHKKRPVSLGGFKL